jgi:hypothetical protein
MKVLQVNKFYYNRGGAETVFFSTIDLLRQHGHEVVPFAMADERNHQAVRPPLRQQRGAAG